MSLFLKSMTGYGNYSLQSAVGLFEAEVQGVNRRYREVALHLPRSLLRFESALRREVEGSVGRGQVNLAIHWRPSEQVAPTLIVNVPFVRRLKEAYGAVAGELGITEPLRLADVIDQEELFFRDNGLKEESMILEALLTVTRGALEAFIAMRLQEGQWLAQDLVERLREIRSACGAIAQRARGMTEIVQQRLQKRTAPYFSEANSEDRERLLKEIVLIADRVDISEELVRSESHFTLFEAALAAPFQLATDTKGKRLDFLIQECGRELNTIGSKAQDAEVARHVVDAKTALERMREQVQNIE